MKKTVKLLALVLLMAICTVFVIPPGVFAEEYTRGSIIGMEGQPLAYTDPANGVRVYPNGDLGRVVLGDVYDSGQGTRGLGGVEESMDAWLYPSNESFSVQVTLDMELQKAAEDALNGLIETSSALDAKGSIVVMDMRGRVLAMASVDKTPQDIRYNNAIARRSAPGELFMMVPALKAIDAEVLTHSEIIWDGGLYTRYDQQNPPRCWVGVEDLAGITRHANQTLTHAVQNCCYYYAFVVAERLGLDGELMQEFAQEAGLSGKTGIELPDESESFVSGQSTLYTPSDWQYTRIPALVFEETSRLIAERTLSLDIQVTTEALQDCVDRMRHMAYEREQGEDALVWRDYIMAYLEAIGFTPAQASDPSLVDPVITQLERLKYSGSDMLQTAIGQSITQVTPIAMARYMAAIANGGDVYPASIVEGIMLEDEWYDRYVERMPERSLSAAVRESLPSIREGMRGEVDYRQGSNNRYFQGWQYADQVGSMKAYGESYETCELNSIWYAGFAPFAQPEIVVVVNLLDGNLAEDHLASTGQKVFEVYLDKLFQ